jgi:hypothetical protein
LYRELAKCFYRSGKFLEKEVEFHFVVAGVAGAVKEGKEEVICCVGLQLTVVKVAVRF